MPHKINSASPPQMLADRWVDGNSELSINPHDLEIVKERLLQCVLYPYTVSVSDSRSMYVSADDTMIDLETKNCLRRILQAREYHTDEVYLSLIARATTFLTITYF